MTTDAYGIIAALGEQHDELNGILAGLNEADWQRPTRCEGWVVADVVLHLAQSDEMSIASLRGHLPDAAKEILGGAPTGATTGDEGAAAMVNAQRGQPSTAIYARWQDGISTLRSVLSAVDGRTRVQWIVGELSATTLATTRLAETWIHAGDVAQAVGVRLVPADRLSHIARLAWRTLPFAFARAGRELSGPVAFELTGPGGAAWSFVPDDEPVTRITGDGYELCLVAGQRLDWKESSLKGSGPDADAVLELVRTYA